MNEENRKIFCLSFIFTRQLLLVRAVTQKQAVRFAQLKMKLREKQIIVKEATQEQIAYHEKMNIKIQEACIRGGQGLYRL